MRHFEKSLHLPSLFSDGAASCVVAVQNTVVVFIFHRLALINTNNSTQMFRLMRSNKTCICCCSFYSAFCFSFMLWICDKLSKVKNAMRAQSLGVSETVQRNREHSHFLCRNIYRLTFTTKATLTHNRTVEIQTPLLILTNT